MDKQTRILKLAGIAVIILTYIAAMPASEQPADRNITVGTLQVGQSHP